jgi:hypothetical protein
MIKQPAQASTNPSIFYEELLNSFYSLFTRGRSNMCLVVLDFDLQE